MDARLPVSVLLLARDEGWELEALIPALAFAREVVVVWDPRGSEETRAAAARMGARVFPRELDGFGAQRQFALAQCREAWVLWIDADEWLDPAAVDALGWLAGLPAPQERLRARAPHVFPRPPHPLLRLAERARPAGLPPRERPLRRRPGARAGARGGARRAPAGRARAPQLRDLGRLRAQAHELRARGRGEGAAARRRYCA